MNQETLNPQPRRRQFRDVRQSHSRSKSLIASQLSKSVGKSRTNRQFLNEREPNSRFSNLQNQEQDSRVLKECTKNHQNHQQSLSHKNLMCVCCYNKKQTELRHRQQMRQKRKQEKEANDMKQSLIQQNLHKQLLYESHLRQGLQQMTEYNKRLMEKHQREKLEEIDKKKEDQEKIIMLQHEIEQEKKNRLKQTLQQQKSFKHKLEQQMKMTYEKTKRQQTSNEADVFIVDAIVPKKQYDRKCAETLKAAYKQELLRQIDAKNAKKRKQIEDEKGLSSKDQTNEFQLITFAEKRNEEARRIASQFKQTLQNDINEKKNLEQIAKQKKQSQRLQQEKERKKISLEQQAQRLKQEDMRRQKIDNYLFDLRSQIQQNKRKRLQQIQFINERKAVEPIIKSQAVKEQACEECHKKYPKKMLSEFVTLADL